MGRDIAYLSWIVFLKSSMACLVASMCGQTPMASWSHGRFLIEVSQRIKALSLSAAESLANIERCVNFYFFFFWEIFVSLLEMLRWREDKVLNICIESQMLREQKMENFSFFPSAFTAERLPALPSQLDSRHYEFTLKFRYNVNHKVKSGKSASLRLLTWWLLGGA